MMRRQFDGARFDRIVFRLMAALLTLAVLWQIPKLLAARVSHDTPIMLFIAYQIDHYHLVPYRQTFDMNMPESYLFYLVLGRLSGYHDHAIRVLEIGLLLLLAAVTWRVLRGLSRSAAVLASSLFILNYIRLGSIDCLQREFFMTLFIAAALAILFDLGKSRTAAAAGLSAFCIGLACMIKPQVALLWPIVPLYLIRMPGRQSRSGQLPIWAWSSIGVAVPCAVTVCYLVATHSLKPFLDVAVNYWPLYGSMNGNHQVMTGIPRLRYIFTKLAHRLVVLAPFAAFGGVVGYTGRQDAEQRRQILALAAVAGFFAMYPAFSGQFWPYHWMPVEYFTCLLASLCCIAPTAVNRRWYYRPVRMLAFLLFAVVLLRLDAPLSRRDEAERDRRVDAMSAYLAGHLRPGDTVQPLDWTGGAVQAMLYTHARLATPFVYDFHFYHNVSNPYIRRLRSRFIFDLDRARPRWIVQVTGEDKPWPGGPDTTRSFPELQAILAADYRPVDSRLGYVIWQRNGRP